MQPGWRAVALGWLSHRVMTVRQILEHVGEPTTALAIALARSPWLEIKIEQQMAASEAKYEVITELDFGETASLMAKVGND